uniref:Uncharacterized protein n=1 Tax=Arundo donax TaxID=35708 RepID=A0A0A9BS68_ARUDO
MPPLEIRFSRDQRLQQLFNQYTHTIMTILQH